MNAHTFWTATGGGNRRRCLPGVVLVALSALLLFHPEAASALEVFLTGDGKAVFLWKTPQAMEQAIKVLGDELGADAKPALRDPVVVQAAPFAACVVPFGTRAQVNRVPNSWLWEATVIEGPRAGCRGVVRPTDFNTADEILHKKQEQDAAQAKVAEKARQEHESQAARSDQFKRFRAAVPRLVREARRFQTPSDALDTWGDPHKIFGAASPELDYEGSQELPVTLSYAPPARHPHRLKFIDIRGPLFSERTIIDWLGNPLRVRREDKETRLDYEGNDKAGLKVLYVWVRSGEGEFAFTYTLLRFAPR